MGNRYDIHRDDTVRRKGAQTSFVFRAPNTIDRLSLEQIVLIRKNKLVSNTILQKVHSNWLYMRGKRCANIRSRHVLERNQIASVLQDTKINTGNAKTGSDPRRQLGFLASRKQYNSSEMFRPEKYPSVASFVTCSATATGGIGAQSSQLTT